MQVCRDFTERVESRREWKSVLWPTLPAGERGWHDGPQPGGAGGYAAQHPAGRERQRGGGPARWPLPPPRAGESFFLLHRVLPPPTSPASSFGSASFQPCRFLPLPATSCPRSSPVSTQEVAGGRETCQRVSGGRSPAGHCWVGRVKGQWTHFDSPRLFSFSLGRDFPCWFKSTNTLRSWGRVVPLSLSLSLYRLAHHYGIIWGTINSEYTLV